MGSGQMGVRGQMGVGQMGVRLYNYIFIEVHITN